MRKGLIAIATCFLGGFLLADEKTQQPDKGKEAQEKVIGTVVVDAGQPLPIRVSFVDLKAAEEKRETHPVSVPVDKDGKFAIPGNLKKLPDGYLLTTYPCVKLKEITVSGIDIRTAQGAEASKLGSASTFARSVSTFSDFASSLLGGVKFSDCGGDK